MPKDLGHFGEKTPLNQPNQTLAFLEKNATFLSVCIIYRILPSIYSNMIQSKKINLKLKVKVVVVVVVVDVGYWWWW